MPPFDPTLINYLREEVEKERWEKKLKINGRVKEKKLSKKGSIILTIEDSKAEHLVIIPKFRQEEYKTAQSINEGDLVYVVGEKKTNAMFCEKIEIIEKCSQHKLNH